jgi:uncharacterized protein YjbI with pentapeptide repeats
LEQLSLGGTKVTSAGLRAIAELPIKWIDLRGCELTEDAFKVLGNMVRGSLRQLWLSDSKMQGQWLKYVSQSKLKELRMSGSNFDDSAAANVAAMPNLEKLILEKARLSESTFQEMAKAVSLRQLWLKDASLKGEWLKHISALPELTHLSLSGSEFDDSAVKYLSRMPSLEVLVLDKTRLGDVGFGELLKLPKLQIMFVEGTNVSREAIEKARKDHPKVHLDVGQ